ncbi:hypothetical protein A3K34_04205 [candidate division WWE3 bacterium RIFOXYC1_FULL_40_10]|uniref:Sortase n=1 Tax=candidate division WWE3 bacterium RIFOXYA2_FULL_46_9 TaxID=1802636 RepID=A0A1F4W0N2_UNCKA|nr:MAG: hypothetical protein A3K58_04205 [candidate division WWE3 bacterium RIFOXYB1_FULL_40_22]OGC62044.1 MAG: hypothetical protein A3K37_04205 [candidate division WWE3 bacterium RIFOXYA1_FULL_40_11]OGC62961.1 MAG: hypothetical protein A2264_03725 [candidate division WWE3 bacterium RIFOXYA2_FULL_46_9]OGC65012.1 MAG: hypothetical protein A2326_03165 [candidate division WWE3 bacterium RIFOXYB2_FULL_41_6]OGC66427.1 MAG: hypothetical protein A3K34_04205 [candidate division WWE3 bacterium RIFOXYC1_
MPRFRRKTYIKDNSFDTIYRSVNYPFFLQSKVFSGILLAAGVLVMSTQVIVPVIIFKTQDNISKPANSSLLGWAAGFGDFSFTELKSASPYKLAKQVKGTNTTILPEKESLTVLNNSISTLDIPKLGIANAQIEINSPNLSPDNLLGHYPGSALPGQVGNSFIYGHSVLPWFYNPRNYKTIFSTLDKLKPGDTFTITKGTDVYTYKVSYTEVQKPSNVNPLAEFRPKEFNESTMTLMTCWPAGTKSSRLMVRAELIEL